MQGRSVQTQGSIQTLWGRYEPPSWRLSTPPSRTHCSERFGAPLSREGARADQMSGRTPSPGQQFVVIYRASVAAVVGVSSTGHAMRELPRGTVTFLSIDLEGTLIRWDALIDAQVEQFGGRVVRSRGEGDSRFAVFTHASDALS